MSAAAAAAAAAAQQASAFADAAELQKLIDMFTSVSNAAAASHQEQQASGDDAARAPAACAGLPPAAQHEAEGAAAPAAGGEDDVGFALGYQVTPINVHTGKALTAPQTLTGTAAMAAHVMLMKIHSRRLVRASTAHGVGGNRPS